MSVFHKNSFLGGGVFKRRRHLGIDPSEPPGPIGFIAHDTVANGTLNFSTLGASAGNLLLFSNGRTLSTPPALPATDWHEIIVPFIGDISGLPFYRIWWWAFMRSGLTDPIPSENGRKRVVVYENAYIKPDSAVVIGNEETGTAGSVPGITAGTDELGVFNLYCRNTQASLAAYEPDGSTQRFHTPGSANNECGGDGSWVQKDFTMTASSPYAALGLILKRKGT